MIKITKSKLLRKFKAFDLFREEWVVAGATSPTTMLSYRNKSGDYVDSRMGRRRGGIIRAIAERGIAPELRTKESSTCSIGKGGDGKWYGWSHRAMHGFGIGDKLFSVRFSVLHPKTPFRRCGTKTIKTHSDAKLAAKRFASSVS